MKKLKLLLNIAAVMGLGALSGQSWAGCSIQYYSSATTRNVTLPDISVPATAAVGDLLATIDVPDSANTWIYCSAPSWGAVRYGTSRAAKTGGTLPADVYEVKTTGNVDSGIGVKVTYSLYGVGPATPEGSWSSTQWVTGASSINVSISGVKILLYKTGTITPGELQFPNNFIEGWISTSQYSFSTYSAVLFNIINISNSPKVKIPSCETPNLTVNLGKHAKADFGGIGATSSETPFDFVLNNCSPGMTAVKFTFKPAAGITLVNSGTAAQHLSLKSDSTASGVGVQVLYQDGTLIPFNTANSIPLGSTDYNASTGGTFKVPMKARYIQTASTVSGGTANSAVEFTMTYE